MSDRDSDGCNGPKSKDRRYQDRKWVGIPCRERCSSDLSEITPLGQEDDDERGPRCRQKLPSFSRVEGLFLDLVAGPHQDGENQEQAAGDHLDYGVRQESNRSTEANGDNALNDEGARHSCKNRERVVTDGKQNRGKRSLVRQFGDEN